MEERLKLTSAPLDAPDRTGRQRPALRSVGRGPCMHSALKIGVRGTFCARPMLFYAWLF